MDTSMRNQSNVLYYYDHFKLNGNETPQQALDNLPMFERGLVTMNAIVVVWYLSSLALSGQKVTRNLKPYFFLYHSFMCGVYGAGSVLALCVSNGLENFVTCQQIATWPEMGYSGILRVYIAYCGVMFKFVDTLAAIIRGKGLARVVYHTLEIMGAYIVFRSHFADNLVFCMLPHALFLSFYNLFQLYATVGPVEKHLRMARKVLLSLLNLLQAGTLFSMGSYYLIQPSCQVAVHLAWTLVAFSCLTFFGTDMLCTRLLASLVVKTLIISVLSQNVSFFDPNLNMCFDGVPNAVVTMADRKTYIFKSFSYWELTNGFTGVSQAMSIRDNFPGLPPADIDLAFTVWSEPSKATGTFERTLIAKNGTWYQVFNKTIEATGNTTVWFGPQRAGVNASLENFDQVMTQLNDSVATIKGLDVTGRGGLLSPNVALNFDDFALPDTLPSVSVLTNFFERGVRNDIRRADGVYLVPTVDMRFLLFVERRMAGSYCLMPNARSSCILRDASLLFTCPPGWQDFKDTNWLARIYFGFGVSTRVLVVLIVGAQVGVAIVLFILTLLVVSKLASLWKHYSFRIT